ncbi:hypothetical protein N9850_08840 [Granulosicoccus sp.]|nr:hypothetical protein [Granulosicoccus sp.]MDB4223867.1 hypothetical protein [Granulosicoccus sp.]
MQESIPENCDLLDTFTYEVDVYDTVCRVGSNKSGGYSDSGMSCKPSTVHFDSMFSDKKTCSVFREILQHVRTTQDVVSFPYRCDTETMCLYYRLTVSICIGNHVLFYNKLLGVDSRPYGVRWERVKPEGGSAIPLCSICNKFSVDERWIEFQEMIDLKYWPESGKEMPCAYTVCLPCEKGIRHRVNESSIKLSSASQS